MLLVEELVDAVELDDALVDVVEEGGALVKLLVVLLDEALVEKCAAREL